MRRIVLDAGVFLDWFDAESPHRSLRAEYEAGSLAVIGPRGLIAEALGTLTERGVGPERLARIGGELQRIGLQLQDPPMPELATWLGKGLAPHRAAYPALAATLEIPLVTDDPELRRVAATVLQRG
jgi:predicted nucleic acid-binding protein